MGLLCSHRGGAAREDGKKKQEKSTKTSRPGRERKFKVGRGRKKEKNGGFISQLAADSMHARSVPVNPRDKGAPAVVMHTLDGCTACESFKPLWVAALHELADSWSALAPQTRPPPLVVWTHQEVNSTSPEHDRGAGGSDTPVVRHEPLSFGRHNQGRGVKQLLRPGSSRDAVHCAATTVYPRIVLVLNDAVALDVTESVLFRSNEDSSASSLAHLLRTLFQPGQEKANLEAWRAAAGGRQSGAQPERQMVKIQAVEEEFLPLVREWRARPAQPEPDKGVEAPGAAKDSDAADGDDDDESSGAYDRIVVASPWKLARVSRRGQPRPPRGAAADFVLATLERPTSSPTGLLFSPMPWQGDANGTPAAATAGAHKTKKQREDAGAGAAQLVSPPAPPPRPLGQSLSETARSLGQPPGQVLADIEARLRSRYGRGEMGQPPATSVPVSRSTPAARQPPPPLFHLDALAARPRAHRPAGFAWQNVGASDTGVRTAADRDELEAQTAPATTAAAEAPWSPSDDLQDDVVRQFRGFSWATPHASRYAGESAAAAPTESPDQHVQADDEAEASEQPPDNAEAGARSPSSSCSEPSPFHASGTFAY